VNCSLSGWKILEIIVESNGPSHRGSGHQTTRSCENRRYSFGRDVRIGLTDIYKTVRPFTKRKIKKLKFVTTIPDTIGVFS